MNPGEYYWIRPKVEVLGGWRKEWMVGRVGGMWKSDPHFLLNGTAQGEPADCFEIGPKVIGPNEPICDLRFAVEAKEELRDRFAMAALPAMIEYYLNDDKSFDARIAALGAFEYADAMLEARKEKA